MKTLFSSEKSSFEAGKVRDVFGKKYSFSFLIDLPLEENPKCRMGVMHRHIGFFGCDGGYSYSGQTTKAQKLTPELQDLLDRVNKEFCSDSEFRFNGILVNYYDDGDSYIGEHRDDTSRFAGDLGVLAISIGQSRKFRVRASKDVRIQFEDGTKKNVSAKEIVCDYQTQTHEFMWMKGCFQEEFLHGIPKETTNRVSEPRYSLTFRCHVDSKKKTHLWN